MGIQKSGPFGGFYKKTGPIIGRRAKGMNIITALHHPSNKSSTVAQLSVQGRFTMLNTFLRKLKVVLMKGFGQYAKGRSAMNAAFSYNYPHAFVEVAGLLELNYPLMVYSRGHVSPVSLLSMSLNSGVLELSWATEQESMYCRNTDLATVLVYNVDKEMCFMSEVEIRRGQLGCSVDLPASFTGKLHCYLSFSSADGRLTGDSRYLGELWG